MDRISSTAIICVTLLSVFLMPAWSFRNPVYMFHNRVSNDDTNRFVNCGPPESELVLNWTPRVLRPGVQLQLDVSFKFIESFVHGVVCVTIWLKDVPDPIYQDCRDQQCTDAQKIAKKLIPSFQCPIQKGFSIRFSKMPYTLQPTMPLPSGSFVLAANITNQDRHPLFCIRGEVEINDE